MLPLAWRGTKSAGPSVPEKSSIPRFIVTQLERNTMRYRPLAETAGDKPRITPPTQLHRRSLNANPEACPDAHKAHQPAWWLVERGKSYGTTSPPDQLLSNRHYQFENCLLIEHSQIFAGSSFMRMPLWHSDLPITSYQTAHVCIGEKMQSLCIFNPEKILRPRAGFPVALTALSPI
jgi:hypothetical protein